jgi:sigma54-dependent transcription regulator
MTSDISPTQPASQEITSGFPEAGEPRFESIDAVRSGLAGVQYLADDGISSVVYLADRLAKPVLVEGPAGTGRPNWPSRWPG